MRKPMNKAEAKELAARFQRRGFVAEVFGDEDERVGAIFYAYKVRFRCHSCEAVAINGVPCHESGCVDALEHDCFQCGVDPVRHRGDSCESCRESASADL